MNAFPEEGLRLDHVRMVYTGSIGLEEVLTDLREQGYSNDPQTLLRIAALVGAGRPHLDLPGLVDPHWLVRVSMEREQLATEYFRELRGWAAVDLFAERGSDALARAAELYEAMPGSLTAGVLIAFHEVAGERAPQERLVDVHGPLALDTARLVLDVLGRKPTVLDHFWQSS